MFCAILSVYFCKGHFVIVLLNFPYLHCLQHVFLEYLFNYIIILKALYKGELLDLSHGKNEEQTLRYTVNAYALLF